MKRTITFAAAVVLSGCVTTVSNYSTAKAPVCSTPAGCEAAWAAARGWIIDNSVFKISSYSADYMTTFNSTYSSTQLAIEVSKEPIGNGAYQINAHLWCTYRIGCKPDPTQAREEFNEAVNAKIKAAEATR